MEDDCIIPGKYAYQFRVDLSHNKQSEMMLDAFFFKFDIIKYLGEPEKGEKTNKEHYQFIVWLDEPCDNASKYRNWWIGKVPKKKGGGVSFTNAKKIKSLAKYVKKDNKKLITNLTPLELERVGQWEPKITKEKYKKNKYKQLKDNIWKRRDTWENHNTYSNDLEKERRNIFYRVVLTEYEKVYDKIPIVRSIYYKLAYELQVIDSDTFLRYLGINLE